MSDDTLVLPIMDDVRLCLAHELETSPGETPCVVTLVPGASVPADYCSCGKGTGGCGQAWVRLVRAYPSSVYPTPDLVQPCATVPLAAVLEIGVIRCLPTSQAGGAPPTAVQLTEATRVQLGDWAAMLRTLRCCEALQVRSPILGNYDPRSQGACGGGAWQFTVRLGGPPR